MTFTPKQIRGLIEPYLNILYPHATDVEITFLVWDEARYRWKVNIRFKRKYGELDTLVAMLAIDSTGDISDFKEGYVWIK